MVFKINNWLIMLVLPIALQASERKTEAVFLIQKQQKRPVIIQGGKPGKVRELANFYIKMGLTGIGCQPSKDKSNLIWEYFAIKGVIDKKYKKFIKHPSVLNIKEIYEPLSDAAAKTPEGERHATIRLKNKELAQNLYKASAQDKDEMRALLVEKYKEAYERWQKLAKDRNESSESFYANYKCAEIAFEKENYIIAHNKITEAFECALDTVFAQVERKSEDEILNEISSAIIRS